MRGVGGVRPLGVRRLTVTVAMWLPLLASAQVYKWTDEKGIVNYGNKPAANARNVVKLIEDDSKVSTVPGVSAAEMQGQRERSAQDQVERLERDLEQQRRAANTARADAHLQWRERCIAERRVDCDDPSGSQAYDAGSPALYPYFPHPIVRHRRPASRTPLVTQEPPVWPAPGGAVVPSPPGARDPSLRAPPRRGVSPETP